jgi:hypothetical protein
MPLGEVKILVSYTLRFNSCGAKVRLFYYLRGGINTHCLPKAASIVVFVDIGL